MNLRRNAPCFFAFKPMWVDGFNLTRRILVLRDTKKRQRPKDCPLTKRDYDERGIAFNHPELRWP